eukprot:4742728-Prymnesium_polylepis.1
MSRPCAPAPPPPHAGAASGALPPHAAPVRFDAGRAACPQQQVRDRVAHRKARDRVLVQPCVWRASLRAHCEGLRGAEFHGCSTASLQCVCCAKLTGACRQHFREQLEQVGLDPRRRVRQVE